MPEEKTAPTPPSRKPLDPWDPRLDGLPDDLRRVHEQLLSLFAVMALERGAPPERLPAFLASLKFGPAPFEEFALERGLLVERREGEIVVSRQRRVDD
jgi:hypothetical protein